MDIKGNTSPNFRMEKSIMSKKNMDELYEVTKDRVPESILQYICYTHQYNIFGYGFIDPVDFEEKMKFTPRYLQEKIEDTYQNRIKPTNTERNRENLRKRKLVENPQNLAYENRFENGLFVLENYPMIVNTTSVDTGKHLIRTIRSIRVLKEFSIIQDKKTGKIIYSYELEEEFRRNLDTFYLNANLESIVKLRKSNLGPLYYFLLRLQSALFAKKQTKTKYPDTPQFDYLYEIAGISKNLAKKYQKQKLNDAFNRINQDTELKVELIWEKNEKGQKYVPIISFTPNEEQEDLLKSERVSSVQRFTEKVNVASNEFLHKLIYACPHRKETRYDEAEKKFIDWIKTDNIIFDSEITNCFIETFVNIGCKIPEDIPERIQLFKNYAKTTFDLNNMKTWIGKLFSENFRLTPEIIVNGGAI